MEKLPPQSGESAQEKTRKLFLEMIGAPENASDDEVLAVLEREHKREYKGLNLEKQPEAKKELLEDLGLPLNATYQEISRALDKIFSAKLYDIDYDNYDDGISERYGGYDDGDDEPDEKSHSVEKRPEFGPNQIIDVDELEIGSSYIIHYRKSNSTVKIEDKPFIKDGSFWVKIKNELGDNEIRSLADMGVAPYMGPGGKKLWNPTNWMERGK